MLKHPVGLSEPSCAVLARDGPTGRSKTHRQTMPMGRQGVAASQVTEGKDAFTEEPSGKRSNQIQTSTRTQDKYPK